MLNSTGPLQDRAPHGEGKLACRAEMPGDASLRDEQRRQPAQGMRMTEEELLATQTQGPCDGGRYLRRPTRTWMALQEEAVSADTGWARGYDNDRAGGPCSLQAHGHTDCIIPHKGFAHAASSSHVHGKPFCVCCAKASLDSQHEFATETGFLQITRGRPMQGPPRCNTTCGGRQPMSSLQGRWRGVITC